jgi:hypothetical protein
LLILLRITDSPVHAVECRHNYYSEWIGRERPAMALFLVLSAKGERRVSRDLLTESETMKDKGIGIRKLREWLIQR